MAETKYDGSKYEDLGALPEWDGDVSGYDELTIIRLGNATMGGCRCCHCCCCSPKGETNHV